MVQVSTSQILVRCCLGERLVNVLLREARQGTTDRQCRMRSPGWHSTPSSVSRVLESIDSFIPLLLFFILMKLGGNTLIRRSIYLLAHNCAPKERYTNRRERRHLSNWRACRGRVAELAARHSLRAIASWRAPSLCCSSTSSRSESESSKRKSVVSDRFAPALGADNADTHRAHVRSRISRHERCRRKSSAFSCAPPRSSSSCSWK